MATSLPEGTGGKLTSTPTSRGEARKVSKAKLTTGEKLKVWVRAGGICVLCKSYLLEGSRTGLGVSLGELAHIVGQKESPGSPRGLHELDVARRDDADNVLLACPTCHIEIDDKLIAKVLDVELLMAMKAAHEAHIRHVTTLPYDADTVVLRMVGQLRGDPVDVTRQTATRAVTAAGMTPRYALDRYDQGVEIDLRGLPAEATADEDYYVTAKRVIDEVLTHKVAAAVEAGDVRHVSVFAFARLPLIVYLGSRLTDNYIVVPYQRHRHSQSWEWDDTAPEVTFSATVGDLNGAAEAVLVLNVSGTAAHESLPAPLQTLPTIVISPNGVQSGPDVLRSRASLAAFSGTVRDVNAVLDGHKATLKRIHLLGAIPPAAAVELGRLHERHVHPALAVYSLDDGTYRLALEIA